MTVINQELLRGGMISCVRSASLSVPSTSNLSKCELMEHISSFNESYEN